MAIKAESSLVKVQSSLVAVGSALVMANSALVKTLPGVGAAANPLAGFPQPAALTGEIYRAYLTTGSADDNSNFIFARAPRTPAVGSLTQESRPFLDGTSLLLNGIRIVDGGGFTDGFLRFHASGGDLRGFIEDTDNSAELSWFVYRTATDILEHAFENLVNAGGGFANFDSADNTIAAFHTSLRAADQKITVIIADRINE